MCAEPVEFLFDLSDKLAAACRSDDRAQVEALCGRAMGILESGEFKASTSRLPHRYEHLRRWVPRVCWCARQAKHFSSAVQDPATWQSALEDPSRWRELQEMAEPAQDLAPWAVDMIRWLLGDPPLGNSPVRLGVPVAIVRQQKGEILRLDCETSVPQSGHCFPHPARLLKNFPDRAFQDSFAAAVIAARSLIGISGSVPSVRWTLTKADGRAVGDLSGPSASGAFALALGLLWRGQVPDAGTLVMAECGLDGLLNPVAGVRAKTQAALGAPGSEPVNTIVVADTASLLEIQAIAGRRLTVKMASSVAELANTRSALADALLKYLSELMRISNTGPGFLGHRKMSDVWVDASLVELKEEAQEQSQQAKVGGLALAGQTGHNAESKWSDVFRVLIANPGSCVAVIGPAGAGKSFLTHWTAMEISQSCIEQLRRRNHDLAELYPPFCVPLASLAKSTSANLLDGIIEHVSERKDPGELLKSWLLGQLSKGHACLLLDGADETSDWGRAREFVLQLREHPFSCLLTCREGDWIGVSEAMPETYALWRLKGLDGPAKVQFIARWFTKNETAAQYAIALLSGNTALQHISENPILLSFICSLIEKDYVFSERITATQIYEQVIRGMLVRQRRTGRNATLEQQESILLRLRDTVFPITESDLRENRICFERLMAAGIPHQEITLLRQNGLLVLSSKRGQRVYSLVHRTFLEFLIAWHLAQKVNRNGWDSVAEWVDRKSWHPAYSQLMCFLTGLLNDPVPLLQTLVPGDNGGEAADDIFHHRLILAGLCAGEAMVGKSRALRWLLGRILNKLLNVWQGFGLWSGDGDVHPERPVEALVSRHPDIALELLRTRSDIPVKDLVRLLIKWRILTHDLAMLEVVITRLWKEYDGQSNSVIPLVKSLGVAIGESEKAINHFCMTTAQWSGPALCNALRLIGNFGRSSPAVVVRLQQALMSPDFETSRCAAEAVGRLSGARVLEPTVVVNARRLQLADSPTFAGILAQRLTAQDPAVRGHALELVQMTGSKHKELIVTVTGLLTDPDWKVRNKAIQILTRYKGRNADMQAMLIRSLILEFQRDPMPLQKSDPQGIPNKDWEALMEQLAAQLNAKSSLEARFGYESPQDLESLLCPGCDWSAHHHLLLSCLKSPDCRLRELALLLKRQLAATDDDVFDVALAAAETPDVRIREYAVEWLTDTSSLSPHNGVKLLQCLAQEYHEFRRYFLWALDLQDWDLSELPLLHGPEVERQLIELLNTEVAETRQVALVAARRFQDPSKALQSAMGACITDISPGVRVLAAESICVTPHGAADPLEDENPAVRAKAAQALGRNEKPEESRLKKLFALLQDHEASVRVIAIHVLARFVRPDRLKPLLIGCLHDLSMSVIASALIELARMGETGDEWLEGLDRYFRARGRGFEPRGTPGEKYVDPKLLGRSSRVDPLAEILRLIRTLKLRNPECIKALLKLIPPPEGNQNRDHTDCEVALTLDALGVRVFSINPLKHKTLEALAGET
jgi:hypothetical protein